MKRSIGMAATVLMLGTQVASADAYALGVLQSCLGEAEYRARLQSTGSFENEAMTCAFTVIGICPFSPDPAECGTSVGTWMYETARKSGWTPTGGLADDLFSLDAATDFCCSEDYAPSQFPRADKLGHCLSYAGVEAFNSAVLEGLVTAEDFE